jgi:hypothetical protein
MASHLAIHLHRGGQLGSFWGDLTGQLINQGVHLGVGWLQQQAQGGGGHQQPQNPCDRQLPMRDGGIIAGCIDSIVAQFHQAEAQGASPAQLMQIAMQLQQMLNDPSYFSQSDPYVRQAQGVFAHEIEVLRPLITPPAGTGTNTGNAGGTGQAILPGSIGGLSLQTALIGGAGILVLWVLLQR